MPASEVTYSIAGRERAERLRMAVHMSMSLSLLYYLFPDPVPFVGIPKATGVIALLFLAALCELVRIRSGWIFFLFREYERHRPAAYFWIGTGCCIAVVFFPQRFAILTITGVAFIDPFINTLRPRLGRAKAGAVGACAWAGLGFLSVSIAGLPVPLWLLPIGGVAAACGETIRHPYVDDDFLMNLTPLLTLTALAAALGV